MPRPSALSTAPLAGRLPHWARAADYISLVFLLVAVTVAASGGFRVRVGDWRFALTSPYRILVWAVAIAALRHALVRERPVYEHLTQQIGAWVRAAPFRAAAATFVGTRPAIFFVGYLAIFLLGWGKGAPPYRDFDNELFNLPLRWDAGWYLQIAIHGYTYEERGGAAVQQNIVFFPAYPLAVRVVSLLLGGSKAAFFLGATIVSLAAFFAALAYVFALARDDLSEDGARTALWFLAAYPFACFYGAIYTESLFLLGAAGAFFHFKRAEWWRAAAWGLVAGLTRPNGFLLCVPLGVLAVSRFLPARLVRRRSFPAESDRTALAPALAAAAMPVVGVLLYSLFVWTKAGNPLAWIAGHAAWGRHYSGLTTLVSDRYNYIASAGLYAYVSELPLDLLNALGVIFVLVAAWPVARRLGLAYAAFIIVNILPPIAQGGLMSAGRFSSVLFPAFIWMAAAVPAPHRGGWIASFATLQALNAAMFYTWRQLF
jgi:hypothetical protein